MREARFACLTVTAIAAALLLPASASAGEGGFGLYKAADGEVNNVVASGTGTGVIITDTAGATVSMSAGPQCSQINPTTITCDTPPLVGSSGGFGFLLGDQNDTFSFAGGDFPHGSQARGLNIYGAAGSDNISGSPYNDLILGGQVFTVPDGPDVLRGGDGSDAINGEDGDDIVLGEGGDDRNGGGGGLEGAAGNDIVDGGPGSDLLYKTFHGGGCSGPDTMIGGPGKDTFNASCGEPTLKFRDGEEDFGSCAKSVTSAVKEFDKIDKAYGGACQTYIKTCKKKKKKGKGKSASAAKKKKKKCKRKPYKPPDLDALAASLGGSRFTLTRP